MIYNLDEFAETYRDRCLRRIIVNDTVFHWFDISEMAIGKECDEYGIKRKITYGRVNRFLGENNLEAELDIDNEESISDNPILYQLYKMYKEKYNEEVELGFERQWSCISDKPKVADTFEDMVILIHEMCERIKKREEEQRQELIQKQTIEERKRNVKFKSDPDYFLVKPDEKIF